MYINEMNGVLSHKSALLGYTGLSTTWANEMNFLMNHAPGYSRLVTDETTFGMNHAPGAGWIA